ncbi:hypothetical protein I315_01258 [Cryptococcus gattii Ru294]|nr:hypothetical protein I315_01258 [Cryptococcus gattii Ru294]
MQASLTVNVRRKRRNKARKRLLSGGALLNSIINHRKSRKLESRICIS